MMNNYNSLSAGFITGLKTRLQNKGLLFLLFAFFSVISVNAQFTGTTVTKSAVPIAGSPFNSLFDAINAVNLLTIDGPVVVTCGTGTETALIGGYSITATGSAANTIVIEGNGAANSIITAPTQVAGNLNDAIFKIIGGDFITIQGFTMQEGPGLLTAAASNNMTEWGVALLYAGTTNGSQNCTIQNNNISLNRIYQNTFGIYSNSTHSATAVATSATATTSTGGNSGLIIYGNAISNVNMGIVVVGPTPAADANTGIDIGGTGGVQANSITNYGTTATLSSYANVSGTVNGILVRNSNGFNVSYNSITSSNGGVISGTLNGIQLAGSSVTPTGTFTNTISNNTISLQSGVSAAINGITCPSNSASTTSTLNVNNNNFTAATYTVGSSGTVILISIASTNQFTTINNNTFTNISSNTTGSFTFIAQSFTAPATGTKAVNNNSIVTGFTKTGAGGTVIFVTDNGSTVAGAVSNCQNNNFSNVTLTGATALTGLNYTDGGTAATRTVSGNTLNNLTTGAATINAMNFTYWNGNSSLSSNSITNITGQGAVTGITIGSTVSTATLITIASNTITNLTSTGTGGAVTGIVCSNTSAAININNNAIRTLASTGASAVNGISITGATNTSVFKNTISDLSGSNASSTVNGTVVSSGALVTLSNNRIGDLRTTAANAANPLNGINITGGTTVNVYFNTVNLSGASSGALFGSSAINASTTPTLTLRNNIFVNNSSANGAGLAVAYRRSSATLTSYGAASNNNDFFASTIYTDGVTPLVGFSAFQTLVATRDAASVSVNPSFLSTVSGDANFLKNATTASQIESGGANVTGITDDFENEIRQGNGGYPAQANGGGTAPDIGADEYDGIPAPVCTGTPAASTITGLAAVCTGTGTTLSLSIPYTDLLITYQWRSSTTPGGPYSTTLGASSTQATGNLTVPTYYVCDITCNNGGPFTFTTDEKSVLINALPTVTLNPPTATYCTPGGTAVALTAGGALTYTYTNNATLSPTTGANVSATPAATTTYVVTGTDGNGCTNTASSTVSIANAVIISSTTATPNSVCSGASSQLAVTASAASAYCASTHSSGCSGDYVTRVVLNTLDRTTGTTCGATSAAYSNFTGLTGANTTTLTAVSVVYALSLTFGTDPNQYFGAWIDYNKDGVFTVSEFLGASANAGANGTISVSFTVPGTAFNGLTRLRIVGGNDSAVSSGQACGASSSNFGETQDYDVTITNGTINNTLTYSWTESPALPTTLSATDIANPMANGITVPKSYSVLVSAAGCSATGSTSVGLAAGISIDTNPVASTKCAGQTATFSVTATGPGTLTYQWRKDGVDIPTAGNASAGTATLSLPSVTVADAATYDVVVSTTCGTPVTSTGAALTVNPSVANISVSPSLTVCSGTSVTLTEDGAGNSGWGWSPGGATTNAIIVTPTTTTTYTVATTATNTCTNSASVTIIVSQPVAISSVTATPATVCSGANSQLVALGLQSFNTPTPSNYLFSATSETYSALTGGTSSTAAGDDGTQTSIALGFTFNYNGTPFTTFGISTNGTIQLGTSATSFTNSLATNNNVIAAFWDDNNRNTGTISYLMTGTAPNRVMTIDWNNVSISGGGSAGNSVSSYQMQLFETSNAIKFIYGSLGSPITTPTASIGLSGTSGNFLSVTPAALPTTSSVTENSNISAVSLLPTGTTYTFTPTGATALSYAWTESPALPVTLSATNIANPMANGITVDKTYNVIATGGACSAPGSVSVTVSAGAAIGTHPQASTACVGSTATFTVAATGPTLIYQWRKDGIDIPIAGNASAGTATLSLPAVTTGDNGSSYDVVVSSACGSPVTSTAATLTVVTPLAGINASATTICSGNSVTLTENGGSATSWSWSPGGATTNAITVSPAQTTTYTVTATTVVPGCAATANVTINVNLSPSAVTVTPSVDSGLFAANTICAGNILKLTTSGGAVAESGIANISFGTNLESSGPATTFSANITGIPTGATITSAELQLTNVNSLGGSFRSEIRVALSGAYSLGATQISTLSSNGLISPDPVINLSGFTAQTGAINLVLSESFDDSGVDATFGEVKLVINYSAPVSVLTQNWSSTPATTLYTDAAATAGNEYVSGPATVLYARPTGTTTYYSTALNGSCPSEGSTTINVNALPTFTVAPITICSGSTGTLTAVTAENNSYSWTGGLSGQSVFVSPAVTTTYQAIATSNSGTPACSSNPVSVLVTVNDQGSIITQPVNQITSTGNGATFTVAGTVGVPYTYQWQIRTSTIPSETWSNTLPPANYSGGTTDTLTVSNAIAGNYPAGMSNSVYRCILTPLEPCAPLVSSSATLTVSAIGIASNPQNVSICLPASVSPLPQFNVVTNGSGTITRVLWEVSSDNFSTFTTIPLYATGGNLISSGYTGPNTTAVAGLTFEFPLVASVRDYKTLTIGGINSTTYNNLRFRVRFNNTIVSQSALLTVGSPVVISTDLSTTAIPVCQVPVPASPTVLSITTSGTVSAVVWKYATTAGASDASYSAVTDSTPAGATYVSSNPSTGVYQLSVATTAATPVGNYYYKAFLTGVSPCLDTKSAEATISIVRPTVTVPSSTEAYCTPGPALTLSASGASTYAWTPTTDLTPANGLGASVSATPSVARLYTVTGTDGNGCTNTATVNVTLGGSITAAVSSAAGTICPGTPVALTGSALPVTQTFSGPIGNYSFVNTTEAYDSIVDDAGTVAVTLSSMDDSISATQTIPFTFNFGANNFTTFKINSNGWIQLGATSTSGTNYSPLSGSDNNIIAALSRDLNGNNTTATTYYVKTTGSPGSQITKIEWANIRSFSSSNNPATGNVQIWLYEGTNRVEIRYGDFTTSSGRTSSTTCQVGLRGTSTAAANVRSLSNTGSWASPTLSSSSAATTALGTFAAPLLPDSGRVYRFTPPVFDTNTYTYAWSPTVTGTGASVTASPSVQTTYNLTVTSQSGCKAYASVLVSVDSTPPSIVTQPVASQTLCAGATANFAVVPAASTTVLTYQWKKNGVAIPLATNPTLSGTTTSAASTASNFTSGIYTVDVIGCTTITSTNSVLTVNPLPTATVAGTTSVCQNDAQPSVTFTGVVGTPPFTFTYTRTGLVGNQTVTTTSGNSATVLTPTATAGAFTYTLVSVQDSNTCSQTQTGNATITVNALPTPPVLSAPAVCQGSTLNLNATVAPLTGYTLNSNSGVAFIDINATGTSVGTLSDDSEHNITIPAFTYNAVVYTTARLGNNGLIVFGSTTGEVSFSNVGLPSTASSAGNTFLAPYWDDLDIQTGATCKTQTVGNLHIIQFTTMAHDAFTTGAITFQVQLNLTTGVIHFVYQDVIFGSASFDSGVSATIGLQYNSTAALQYSSNTASLVNGQSLTFTPAVYSYAWTGPSFTSTIQNPSIANATPANSGPYTLELTNTNGCKSSSTVNATVHPTPTVTTVLSDKAYFNGLATASIPLSGTPAGVTFDISGGAGVGLPNQTVSTEIPSFIPTTGAATVTVTPKANGCTGPSVTYNITVAAVTADPVANQTYCEGITTSAIPLTSTPATLTGVTYDLDVVGDNIGLNDATGLTAIPAFVTQPGSATIYITPVYGGVYGGVVSATINVNPLPTATVAGTTEVCRNDASPTITFTGAVGLSPYTFTYKFNGGPNQTIVSSGSGTTATIVIPTGTAGTFAYTLVSVQDSSSTACSQAQGGTATVIVHPTPTVTTTLNNVNYYSGFATAAIPLAGTPSGVVFNITGGAAAGLADVSGVLAIPSFIPTAVPATVTVTPVANGCTGIPKTYQITFIPVVANITSSHCGSVNHGLNNQIQAGSVSVPGHVTTGYRFEVTNTATGEVAYVNSVHSMFKLTDTSIYAYGTTFAIRVAVILDGNVQGFFGNTCTLTTASVQTTKVVTAQCGATLAALNSTINANPVGSTNLYRFRVARADAPTTYYLLERTVPNFNLSMVVGLPLTYETEYKVDVQIRVKLAGFEAWSQFGAVCSVFTPVAPTTSLTLADCELVATSYTQTINIIPYPGATSYRVMLIGYDIDSNVNYTQTFDTASTTFTLSQFNAANPLNPLNSETVYTVSVSILLYGSYTPYGKDCSVTTPVGTGRTGIINVKGFKAVAYPNPFANNFMIDVKSSSDSSVNLKVYDMIGRLVEQRDVRVSDLVTATIGERYPSGVYNVVVSQDESVQTVRVVKR